jgi:tetratricopeptide (TPR) repeat protein
MIRNLLTGVLVTAAAVSALMAQMKPKSNAEAEAVRALFAAQGQSPDATIKAAEDLLTKYADTEYKEVALLLEADAYQQKGDYASAEITDERVLESNPKNPQAAMQLGELILQHVGENDLDKEEQLGKAEKRFNQAIANIDTKPFAGMPDDKWAENKKFTRAQLENDLGLLAMRHKNLDAAIADFKLAVEGDPQPAYQVRLAVAYQQSGKNDEALAICDKLLADPQLHPTIKQLAQSVKTKATQAKSGGK